MTIRSEYAYARRVKHNMFETSMFGIHSTAYDSVVSIFVTREAVMVKSSHGLDEMIKSSTTIARNS